MRQTSFLARKFLPCSVAGAVLLLAALAFWPRRRPGRRPVRHSTPGDLFYNYYVPPVGPGSVGAELYPCPRPTPPLVGHTYITYQPLMPHEFLYKHHRHYTTQRTKTPRGLGRRCIGDKEPLFSIQSCSA